MKLVLLLIAVFALFWLLRASLRRHLPPRTKTPPPPVLQPMVGCTFCGLHLPRDEALPGRGGVFCGEAHRSAYEQQHPES